MIALNIRQLALDEGVDSSSAYDKESFIISSIKNAGLAPVSISDESVTVENNLVTGYEVTLHFGDATTCQVTYTATNLGDSYQYHRVAVSGSSPFMVEKREKKDFVRGGNPISPTPTPTGLPPTPTPTPVAIASQDFLTIAQQSAQTTMGVRKLNNLTGFDAAFGYQEIMPVGMEYVQFYGHGFQHPTNGYYFIPTAESATQLNKHIYGFDSNLATGLTNPHGVQVSTDAYGLEITPFGNRVVSTAVVTGGIELKLFDYDGTTGFTQVGATLSVPGSYSLLTNTQSTIVLGDTLMVVRDDTFAEIDRNLIETFTFNGTNLVQGPHTLVAEYGAHGPGEYTIKKAYVVDDHIVLLGHTSNENWEQFPLVVVLSYDETTGFTEEFRILDTDFPFTEEGVDLVGIDVHSTPARLHASLDYGMTGYVGHLDFTNQTVVHDYVVPIDPATYEPELPGETYKGFAILRKSWNEWANTRIRFMQFVGANYQTTWDDPEEMVGFYTFKPFTPPA